MRQDVPSHQNSSQKASRWAWLLSFLNKAWASSKMHEPNSENQQKSRHLQCSQTAKQPPAMPCRPRLWISSLLQNFDSRPQSLAAKHRSLSVNNKVISFKTGPPKTAQNTLLTSLAAGCLFSTLPLHLENLIGARGIQRRDQKVSKLIDRIHPPLKFRHDPSCPPLLPPQATAPGPRSHSVHRAARPRQSLKHQACLCLGVSPNICWQNYIQRDHISAPLVAKYIEAGTHHLCNLLVSSGEAKKTISVMMPWIHRMTSLRTARCSRCPWQPLWRAMSPQSITQSLQGIVP